MREGYYMKKTLLISCMLLATTGAFANDAFTPINLSSAATTTKTTTAVTGDETLGNGNIQNAILQIDNAQVDIRNQLLELKTKFADWFYYNYVVPGDYKILMYMYKMKDYTKPWTDERYYKTFNLTKDEIKIIEEFKRNEI